MGWTKEKSSRNPKRERKSKKAKIQKRQLATLEIPFKVLEKSSKGT